MRSCQWQSSVRFLFRLFCPLCLLLLQHLLTPATIPAKSADVICKLASMCECVCMYMLCDQLIFTVVVLLFVS